jgi:pimeloyl-ACP methyl ester carboxylesterase
MKVKLLSVAFILILFSVTIIWNSISPVANGQGEKLPVLLIHGYASTASVWGEWVKMLKKDGINATAVTFNGDDRCGDSESHAHELRYIVNDFKVKTGANKINIVAHSKGGLDARVYLAQNLSNDDIANLIMIGTPNRGSPLAYGSLAYPPMIFPYFKEFICWPAVYDLIPYSSASKAIVNENTNYYTIAGIWNSYPYLNYFYPLYDPKCPQAIWLPFERWSGDFILIGIDNGINDGIVPLSSAAPKEFKNLGVTNDCHTNLVDKKEYLMAKTVLQNFE